MTAVCVARDHVDEAEPQAQPHVLACVLRGEKTDEASMVDVESLVQVAIEEGVAPLVGEMLHRDSRGWPTAITARFWRESCGAAAVEVVRRRELVRAVDALAEQRVAPLLLKGTALAYTVYGRPYLRPRIDTDVLVREADLNSTDQVLTRLGYRRTGRISGRLVMQQVGYERTDASVTHALDVHWKLFNRHRLANILSFDELERAAVGVPALSRSSRTVGLPHALLLACLHRVAHHDDSRRLIWLYDIRLLVEQMRRAELHEFVRLARATRTVAACRHGVEVAQQVVGADIPEEVRGLLVAEDGDESDISRVFIGRRMAKIDILQSDLQHLSGIGARSRLLAEHAFPPVAYMRQRYAAVPPALLPACYVDRLVRGAWKWLRRAE